MERIRRDITALLVASSTLIAALGSCASGPEAGPPATDGGASASTTASAAADPVAAMLRDTRPRGGVPVFVGFAPRMHEREKEEAIALEDAAYEALRYLEVRASAVLIAQRSGRDAGYAEAVQTRVDEARLDEIEDDLQIRRSIRDADGTVILAAAPKLPRLEVPPEIPGSGTDVPQPGDPHGGGPIGSHPAWVRETPQIHGFDVAVGVAERRRRRAESVTAADERALGEIVLAREARMRAVADTRRVEGEGVTGQTTKAQEAAEVVRGFYVLSRFVTGDGRYYYSLAVARRETSTPDRENEQEEAQDGD